MSKLAIEVFVPPALTLACWVWSRFLGRRQREAIKPMTWTQSCLLLIAAYLMLATALWGSVLLPARHPADPSTDLVQ